MNNGLKTMEKNCLLQSNRSNFWFCFFFHCFRKLKWFKLVTTKLDLEIMTGDLCLPGQTEETERVRGRDREKQREETRFWPLILSNHWVTNLNI